MDEIHIYNVEEVSILMYPYMTLGDGTEIVRPTEDGFDDARCVLPDYKWTERSGFSDAEMEFFEKLLKSNAHLLYKYAASGGIRIA